MNTGATMERQTDDWLAMFEGADDASPEMLALRATVIATGYALWAAVMGEGPPEERRALAASTIAALSAEWARLGLTAPGYVGWDDGRFVNGLRDYVDTAIFDPPPDPAEWATEGGASVTDIAADVLEGLCDRRDGLAAGLLRQLCSAWREEAGFAAYELPNPWRDAYYAAKSQPTPPLPAPKNATRVVLDGLP